VPCDIFSPCALGAIINDDTIPRLTCRIIAGAANNQLAEPRHADILHEQYIVHAVDYVINAGGLINVSYEAEGCYDEAAARAKTSTIYYTIQNLLDLARTEKINTNRAAMLMAQNALRHTPVELREAVL
ncbi:MAG TPA: hypothetical protein VJZ27_20690, partial [Aggregatilineales bacterium]|nr:hypothetical protein [Aggregatilineales bacterium]